MLHIFHIAWFRARIFPLVPETYQCHFSKLDFVILKSAFLICKRYRDNGGSKRNTAGISYIPHCERRVTGNLTMFSPKSGQESLPYLPDAALTRSGVTVAAKLSLQIP